MSWAAIEWARAQRVGNGAAKSVLNALAIRSDSSHQAWPSQTTLAGDTDLCIRTVRDAINLLAARGFLSRQRRSSAKRGRASDVFTLAVGRVIAPVRRDARRTHLPANGSVFTGISCRGINSDPQTPSQEGGNTPSLSVGSTREEAGAGFGDGPF